MYVSRRVTQRGVSPCSDSLSGVTIAVHVAIVVVTGTEEGGETGLVEETL